MITTSWSLRHFAEIIPLAFQCGHLNDAKQDGVKTAEARLAEEEKSDIFHALVDREQRTGLPGASVVRGMTWTSSSVSARTVGRIRIFAQRIKL